MPTSAAAPPAMSAAVAQRLDVLSEKLASAPPSDSSDSSHTMLFDDMIADVTDGPADAAAAVEAPEASVEGATILEEPEPLPSAAPEQESAPEPVPAAPTPAPNPLPSCQLVLTDQDGAAYELILTAERPTKLVGRDIRSADLLLEDERVSRKHCQLTFNPDDLTVSVEDVGSSNGTRVNGTKITEAQQLHEGDVLRVGHTNLTISLNREVGVCN